MKQRLRARDLSLEPLMAAADKLRVKHSKGDPAKGELVKDFLGHALQNRLSLLGEGHY
jgi:hypothetical protein